LTAEKIEEVEYETLSREDDDATTVDELARHSGAEGRHCLVRIASVKSLGGADVRILLRESR
jgi:hypothetical protein